MLRDKRHNLETAPTVVSQCSVARTVLTATTVPRTRRVTILRPQLMAFALYATMAKAVSTARNARNSVLLGFVARPLEIVARGTTSVAARGRCSLTRADIASLRQTSCATAPGVTIVWKEPDASRTAAAVIAGMVRVTAAPMVSDASAAREFG